MLGDTKLILFFTKQTSLETWHRVGNLDREIALYKNLSKILSEVKFVTYGGKRDKKFSELLGRIKLIPVRWHNSKINTLIELILRHYPELRNAQVLKTNQIKGAEIPIWIKKRFGKKLITRCGYLYSYFLKEKTNNKRKIEDAERLERNAFSSADVSIVTSQWQKEIVVKKYNIDRKKIKVIPNYVVTDVFKPDKSVEKFYDLVYVGRSAKQKNLVNLLKALDHLTKKGEDISLLMIGGCANNLKFQKFADESGLNITFKRNAPNFSLPKFLNKARVFILPSKYEGHPKSLLEAMSCELPCIGTNVIGIKEDIKHMETGYLCDINHESIAKAIDTVLSDKSLRESMGKKAREYVLNEYSLNKVTKMELDIIREVLDK